MKREMKKILLVLCLMCWSSVAFSVDIPQLAKKKNCTSCHAIDKKIVGPAWVEVAKRYKGNVDAPVILTNKIQLGGAGIWGRIPMPKQNISYEEAKELAKFILNLPI